MSRFGPSPLTALSAALEADRKMRHDMVAYFAQGFPRSSPQRSGLQEGQGETVATRSPTESKDRIYPYGDSPVQRDTKSSRRAYVEGAVLESGKAAITPGRTLDGEKDRRTPV